MADSKRSFKVGDLVRKKFRGPMTAERWDGTAPITWDKGDRVYVILEASEDDWDWKLYWGGDEHEPWYIWYADDEELELIAEG